MIYSLHTLCQLAFTAIVWGLLVRNLKFKDWSSDQDYYDSDQGNIIKCMSFGSLYSIFKKRKINVNNDSFNFGDH